ncbi:hypothetical protein BU24DRAFT_428168 [Aaosphaeria arxii CBS 175.79]|uniref:Uncharacterized protein n=1 Tax=Aaosphaeria arxii CBS 175.79 TaxID=1450172 RepID=A0A6A5XAY3_9PLEO|nr:uncharacterized protein BU24DRAFT_428168 [Aaosphaeria arxii CBS 175.79]KAF2010138.1 hypothetical protein BU24DRAFT_428168 [Aaosphaeria arxii CBS 175.79]
MCIHCRSGDRVLHCIVLSPTTPASRIPGLINPVPASPVLLTHVIEKSHDTIMVKLDLTANNNTTQ